MKTVRPAGVDTQSRLQAQFEVHFFFFFYYVDVHFCIIAPEMVEFDNFFFLFILNKSFHSQQLTGTVGNVKRCANIP